MALGAGQLVSGLSARQGSPAVVVGQAAIDLAPPPVKNFAISAFGANDKTALVSGILVALAIFAALIGVVAMRRLAYGYAGLVVFTAIGLAAALSRPNATFGYAVPTILGAAVGAFALSRLIRAAHEAMAPSLRPGARPARRAAVPPDRYAGFESATATGPGSVSTTLISPPSSPTPPPPSPQPSPPAEPATAAPPGSAAPPAEPATAAAPATPAAAPDRRDDGPVPGPPSADTWTYRPPAGQAGAVSWSSAVSPRVARPWPPSPGAS